jgi:hypothetical protein
VAGLATMIKEQFEDRGEQIRRCRHSRIVRHPSSVLKATLVVRRDRLVVHFKTTGQHNAFGQYAD